MDYKVVMPRLSDSMDEGQLVEWKIRPGDVVRNGDVIAEVESDKAVMEIQIFKSGTVKELLIDAGSTVPVGTPMAVIDTDVGSGSSVKTEEKSKEQNSTSVSAAQKPTETVPVKEKRPPAVETKKAPVETQASVPSAIDILMGISDTSTEEKSSYTGGNASPRARALAAKYGLDIETLQNEGKLPVPAHSADVKGYWLRRYFTPKALELIARYNLSIDLFEARKKHDEAEIIAYIQSHEVPLPEPIDMPHKAMIAIVNAAQKRPVYHMTDRIDATLLNHYVSKDLTITVWLLKLFAEAMMRQKYFRLTLTDDHMQLWPNASISVAMAHGEYLYMPVFKTVNTKNPAAIAEELHQFKTKISQKKLTKEDLTGSTFGISNLGMTGIEQFDAMINKDDCAIAAIGSEIEGRITVTLTVDHRIVNGYQAALFMQELKTLAQDEMFFKEVAQ
ncbi:2-oxo acid dehydrogenase subunit E2 [Sulfurovum sp. NBC37-1]|uniref:2-oxo acid dehydrogenase subunit E2 n=1 Tax=Sulfurovum sp. (strain NBC37-1) TaxID=387093 RepID=UPI00015875FD|nr:CatA-like O-acetyltransferase [Sulfurovum sp. NBC37-1]BAF72164.1 pyruvate/2-oxoglutarate dehydrogenase complex, E2 component, dihydrolipoamide acetyltransferase [Sulfurovum sp. NBC37-1]